MIRLAGFALPLLVGLAVLAGWEALVRLQEIPPYLLPAPSRVAESLWLDRAILVPALLVTLKITAAALAAAALTGVALALLFVQSRWLERSLYPYAVVLQVTPVVAIAPLVLIYVTEPFWALLTCATIVAFFPILANTTQGLRATDPGLLDLFRLYGARRWQVVLWLRLPSALPYFLGGLRISGGLALIGAVVAEFAAGSTAGQASGLAYRILEAGYRLNIPRMFAGLVLIALAGITIHLLLGAVAKLALRHRGG